MSFAAARTTDRSQRLAGSVSSAGGQNATMSTVGVSRFEPACWEFVVATRAV
jgi:hypothetical protein